MTVVRKSPDFPLYEISSISSKISAPGSFGGTMRWEEEEMDDCSEAAEDELASPPKALIRSRA